MKKMKTKQVFSLPSQSVFLQVSLPSVILGLIGQVRKHQVIINLCPGGGGGHFAPPPRVVFCQ